MILLEILGLQKNATRGKQYSHENILHLWEDDYLMLELLCIENLKFLKAETSRIRIVPKIAHIFGLPATI